MALRLCITVEVFCLPVRNIFPRTSLPDLPYRRTMRKCSRQISLQQAVSLQAQQKSWIPTYFCFCLQHLCLFDILFECTPNKRGQGMMSVLPESTLFKSIFYIGSIFCFFPSSFIPSTYTDKNSLFLGWRISIPNLELSPNRVLIELSQIDLPTTVLPKDDHKDFAQEERLGLPYWTMI